MKLVNYDKFSASALFHGVFSWQFQCEIEKFTVHVRFTLRKRGRLLFIASSKEEEHIKQWHKWAAAAAAAAAVIDVNPKSSDTTAASAATAVIIIVIDCKSSDMCHPMRVRDADMRDEMRRRCV